MATRYAEVIGDPISHSKSPLIHNFWLRKLGIQGEYRATRIAPGELEGYFASRRGDPQWLGCNVTMPHKAEVLRLTDKADEVVNAIGAANTIIAHSRVVEARNTDVAGIADALRMSSSPGNQVCVIGAGGAAKAALHVLKARGRMDVSLIVRDAEKARALQQSFVSSGGIYSFEECDKAVAGAQWVINSTPLGMLGQQPMPDRLLDGLSQTAEDALVFDMVYAPVETPLLARARALGRATSDGLTMLIGQADAAFRLFFGEPAPREHDRELRDLLTS